jgi:pimeloyl-ACP methyl ester carboxylesterase
MKHLRNFDHKANPAETVSVGAGCARVMVHFQGTGTPLVFLHSSACDSRQWRHFAEDWADRHQIVLPDLPGCGGSDDLAADCTMNLAGDANVVDAISDRLKRPFHLIGHSYGGAVALKSAVRLGARIASLTLIEPTSFHLLRHGDRMERDLFTQIEGFAASVEEAILSGFEETAMRRFVDFWSHPGAWGDMLAAKRGALVPRARKLPGDFSRLFNEELRPADIAKLTIPTLVICGTHSPEPVRALSRLIANAITQSHHRTIAWAGHMLPFTHRVQINRLLEEHLMLEKAVRV